MSLETDAFRWLHWKKKCPFVLWERSPRDSCGRPDMLGVTKARFLMEVEIKRTVADFKANMFKRSVQIRSERVHLYPKRFWFLVPEGILEDCQKILPDWAGLLVSKRGRTVEVVPAPVNKSSKRVSIKECVHIAHLMGSQISTMVKHADSKLDDGWHLMWDGSIYGSEYQI